MVGRSKNIPESTMASKSTNEEVLFDLDLKSQELAEIDKQGSAINFNYFCYPFLRMNSVHFRPLILQQNQRQKTIDEQIERAKHALEGVLASSDSVLEEVN
jgi:hypothetical protein